MGGAWPNHTSVISVLIGYIFTSILSQAGGVLPPEPVHNVKQIENEQFILSAANLTMPPFPKQMHDLEGSGSDEAQNEIAIQPITGPLALQMERMVRLQSEETHDSPIPIISESQSRSQIEESGDDGSGEEPETAAISSLSDMDPFQKEEDLKEIYHELTGQEKANDNELDGRSLEEDDDNKQANELNVLGEEVESRYNEDVSLHDVSLPTDIKPEIIEMEQATQVAVTETEMRITEEFEQVEEITTSFPLEESTPVAGGSDENFYESEVQENATDLLVTETFEVVTTSLGLNENITSSLNLDGTETPEIIPSTTLDSIENVTTSLESDEVETSEIIPTSDFSENVTTSLESDEVETSEIIPTLDSSENITASLDIESELPVNSTFSEESDPTFPDNISSSEESTRLPIDSTNETLIEDLDPTEDTNIVSIKTTAEDVSDHNSSEITTDLSFFSLEEVFPESDSTEVIGETDIPLVYIDTKLVETVSKSDSPTVLTSTAEPKRLGAYIVIAVIVVSFICLIGYITFRNRRRKFIRESEARICGEDRGKAEDKALLGLSDFKDNPDSEVKNNKIDPSFLKQNQIMSNLEKNTNFSSCPKNLNVHSNEKQVNKDNNINSLKNDLAEVIIESSPPKQNGFGKSSQVPEKCIVETFFDQDSIPKKAVMITKKSKQDDLPLQSLV